MKWNEAVLNELPGELYTIEANDKIQDNFKYPSALIQRGLAKLLKLKIGAKVILTVHINIQVFLINDQTGVIRQIEFAQNSARKVYAKFSNEQVGSKATRSSYLGRQNSWIPIEKCETEISVKKGLASLPRKCTQFPLTLAWASTVYKVQGLSLEQSVIDFNLRKLKLSGPGQMYTALNRVETYDNLY